MTKEFKTCWYIRSKAIVYEKVYFSEPVSAEQAIDLFKDMNIDDIMETEVESIDEVLEAR